MFPSDANFGGDACADASWTRIVDCRVAQMVCVRAVLFQ